MHAVIKTGGKQYRVAKDDIITIERLSGDAGAIVTFDQVLMVGDKIGTPHVSGAAVTAKIVEQTRGDKVVVFKKKRRKDYKRTAGHRQDLTVLQITDVAAAAKKASSASPKAAADTKVVKEKATEKDTKEADKAPRKKATVKKVAAKKAVVKKTPAKKSSDKPSDTKK
ncbi:MAG: 50S ribosomal protein L21 [Rhodospirillaceae bacterium]|nr:50S ribosomal protein L21 [Rhodospirillaceae bacterium]